MSYAIGTRVTVGYSAGRHAATTLGVVTSDLIKLPASLAGDILASQCGDCFDYYVVTLDSGRLCAITPCRLTEVKRADLIMT